MSVFLVFITDLDGVIDNVHSVHKTEEDAKSTVSELAVNLRDSEAYYEEHELLGEEK